MAVKQDVRPFETKRGKGRQLLAEMFDEQFSAVAKLIIDPTQN